MPIINVTTSTGDLETIDAQSGLSLMETIVNKGLPMEAICGGCLSCATCHVYIDPEHADLFPAKSEDEEDMLELADHVTDDSRLSCQLRLNDSHDGLKVTLLED